MLHNVERSVAESGFKRATLIVSIDGVSLISRLVALWLHEVIRVGYDKTYASSHTFARHACILRTALSTFAGNIACNDASGGHPFYICTDVRDSARLPSAFFSDGIQGYSFLFTEISKETYG